MNVKEHEHIRRAACHEMGHAAARSILRTLNGVEFVQLTLDDDGALCGNVRVNPDTTGGELLFENVVAKLAGIAAEVLLAGADKHEAIANAADDREQVDRLIARFDEADRVYFCRHGMQSAYSFVEEHRETILRLADELIETQRVEGSRIRELIEEGRTEYAREEANNHRQAILEG